MTGLPVPTLVGITDRLAEDAIRAVVTGGKGTMRPVAGIADTELANVLLYLANPNAGGRGGRGGGRGGRGASGPPLPPGPVVASGGAPLPAARAVDLDPPSYGTNGGNGGNAPYPEEVDVPPARYVTEYRRDGVGDQATLHDADRVRPQHGNDQVAGCARR